MDESTLKNEIASLNERLKLLEINMVQFKAETAQVNEKLNRREELSSAQILSEWLNGEDKNCG